MRDADVPRPVCFQLGLTAPPAMTCRIAALWYASEPQRDSPESSGARNLQVFDPELLMVAHYLRIAASVSDLINAMKSSSSNAVIPV